MKKIILLIFIIVSTAYAAQITTKNIENDAVTNVKLNNMATSTVKGRVTAGTGDPEDLTQAELTSLVNVFTSGLSGAAPASGGGTVNFLRADGSFEDPLNGVAELGPFGNLPTFWGNSTVPGLIIDGTTADALSAVGAGVIFKGNLSQGYFLMASEDQSGSDSSAPIYLTTGYQSGTGGTGGLNLETGWINSGAGNTGPIYIRSGSSDTGGSGLIELGTGTNNSGGSGPMSIYTGSVASGLFQSGDISVVTGAIFSGSAISGDLNLGTGAVDTGLRGRVKIDARSLRLPKFSSDPVATESGETYYNTTSNYLKYYDGSSWQQVGAPSFDPNTSPVEFLEDNQIRLSSVEPSNFWGGNVDALVFDSTKIITTGNANEYAFIMTSDRASGKTAHLQINTGDATVSGNSGGVFQKSGDSTSASAGVIQLQGGAGAINGGKVQLYGGGGGSGLGGDIELLPGTGTTNGKIRLGSLSTVGYVWTADDTSGGGSWAISSGANTTLSNLTNPTAVNQDLIMYTNNKTMVLPNNNPLKARNAANSADISMIYLDTSNRTTLTSNSGAVILTERTIYPAANNTYDLGVSTVAFNEIFSKEFVLANSGEFARISDGTTTPTGVASTIGFRSTAGGIVSMFTSNSAVNDANATASVYIESGNKTAGTGNSGNINATTGTSAGGSRGKINLNSLLLNVSSGGAFVKLIADPCADTNAYPEATLFYNNTSDYYCFCNAATTAKQMHAPATNCF